MAQPGSNTFADRMMAFRTVSIIGEINQSMIADVSARLLHLQMDSSNPINLAINSGGGNGAAAMGLYDMISHIVTAPVHAIVIGRCSSAATFVLLGCKRRLALPHARFVIHSGTASGIDLKINELSLAKATRLFDELKKNAKEIVDFYAQNLAITTEEVKRIIDRGDEEFDNEMSAQEAKSIGLITEIVTKNIGLFPLPEEKPST